MSAPDFLLDWTRRSDARPVPEEFAEPLRRVLDAFQPGSALFVLRRSAQVAPDWLNETRLHTCLHSPLIEAAHLEFWPLLPEAWIVCIRFPRQESEESPLWVHTLRHSLRERLSEEWRKAQGLALAVSEATDETPIHAEPPFEVFPLVPFRAEAELDDHVAQLNSLLEIIVNKQLQPQFQPLVDLKDGQVFGYEALIRGPKGGDMRRFGAMFRAADKASMVSWFDIACIEQCFARAAALDLRKHLFVNMEAEGLAYLDLNERPLALRAREHGLSPGRIVIEITERQAVEDFPQLTQYIARLREQGFKIAIDDAGAGYNSLYTIAEMRPDFVKIDRSLTRNLNTVGERRALMAALVQFARQIGTAVLAEGAETREELATLIELGVNYGQGYLMGKPADDFRGIPRPTREFIQQHAHQRELLATGRSVAISALARRGVEMSADTLIGLAAAKFAREATLTSIVVLEDGSPRGLIMRHQIEHVLDMAKAAQIPALMPEESIDRWMRTNVLHVDEGLPVSEVARMVTTRSDISLETDVIVVRKDMQYVGVVPVRLLIEAALTVQENRQRYADPLTGLPGRVALEQTLHDRLAERAPVAILWADIDRFDLYNQLFGPSYGDEVIHAVQHLFEEVSLLHGSANDFLAHLGGDDFVLLTEPSRAVALCQALVAGFEALTPRFYKNEQARNGYVDFEDRNGNRRQIPLMRMSVAGITSPKSRMSHYVQIMQDLAVMLRNAHRQSHSRYLLDAVPPRPNDPKNMS